MRAFTLIEMLIVISIIGLLATVSIVAFNPRERFAEARNSERIANVTSLLSALKIYQFENNGEYPSQLENLVTAGMGSGTWMIGADIDCATIPPTCSDMPTISNTDCVSLESLVTNGNIPMVPMDPDPLVGSTSRTGYYLNFRSSGIIDIGACEAELSQHIEVSR